jgi:hypothetical protein
MIDDKDAIKSLKDTEGKAKNSDKALKDLGKQAGELGKKMAIGIGVAVTALGGLVMKSAEATDRVDKMSQRLGMSRKSFQEWDYILSQNGVSMDSMNTAMKSMTTAMSSLSEGGKKGEETLGKLGISISDLKNLKQEEIFEKAVIALQGMDEGFEKARLSQLLFGKQGQEMLPMLNQSKGSIEELKQRAQDLGLVLGDEAIDAGVKFYDTMDSAKRMLTAVSTEIGITVMPIVQQFLDWVMTNMPQIKEVMSTAFNAIADAIKWVSDNANWLIPILAGLLGGFIAMKVIGVITTLMGIWTAITTAAATSGGILNAVMLAFPGMWIALIIGAVIAGIVLLIMNFDKVKTAAVGLWDKIKEVFGGIRDFIKGVFDNFKNIIKLPKLSITGSLNPIKWVTEGLPKLNVKWNAEGGIFDSPTIFGTQYGLQGVGEAGAEAIMPLSKLQDLLDMNTIDYDQLAFSMKKALKGMAIQLDDEKVGSFVDTRLLKGAI